MRKSIEFSNRAQKNTKQVHPGTPQGVLVLGSVPLTFDHLPYPAALIETAGGKCHPLLVGTRFAASLSLLPIYTKNSRKPQTHILLVW
jgi:hypothetical protein